MNSNSDTSLTIDTHHHILPEFFWCETNDSHVPVGGLAPMEWSKEAMVSFMDDAGIDVAVMSVSTPGLPGLRTRMDFPSEATWTARAHQANLETSGFE